MGCTSRLDRRSAQGDRREDEEAREYRREGEDSRGEKGREHACAYTYNTALRWITAVVTGGYSDASSAGCSASIGVVGAGGAGALRIRGGDGGRGVQREAQTNLNRVTHQSPRAHSVVSAGRSIAYGYTCTAGIQIAGSGSAVTPQSCRMGEREQQPDKTGAEGEERRRGSERTQRQKNMIKKGASLTRATRLRVITIRAARSDQAVARSSRLCHRPYKRNRGDDIGAYSVHATRGECGAHHESEKPRSGASQTC